MKPIPAFLIAGLAVVGAAGYWVRPSKPSPDAAFPAAAPAPHGSPAATSPASLHPGAFRARSDHEEIFRRAFWRRPAPDDTIVHAEGRQWTDPASGDVLHWQWFIAVQASPELHAWLRDTNPFSLRPAESLALPSAPSWFPAEAGDLEVFQGGAGASLVMAYRRTDRTVFAASSGKGLSRGADAPGAPRTTPTPSTAAVNPAAGRLPNQSPPTPASR